MSIGTLANEKYLSHCLNELKGSSLENVGKSNLGLAMERLNWLFWLLGLVWFGWLEVFGVGGLGLIMCSGNCSM
jgi:hypothetical protein